MKNFSMKRVFSKIREKLSPVIKKFDGLKLRYQILITITIFLILVILLSAFVNFCLDRSSNTLKVMNIQTSSLEDLNLYQIPDTYLYYDGDTKIVYYIIFSQDSIWGRSFGLMSPYYSSNGRMCRYEDNKIIVIDN